MFSYVAARAGHPDGVVIVVAPVMLLLSGEPSTATLSDVLQHARDAQLNPSESSFDALLSTLRNSTDSATDHFALLRVDVVNERAVIAFGGTACAFIDDARFTSPDDVTSSDVRLGGVAQITLSFEGRAEKVTAPAEPHTGIIGPASTLLPLAEGVAFATSCIWQRESAMLHVPRETQTGSPILHLPPATMQDLAPAPQDFDIKHQAQEAERGTTGPFDLLFEHTQFHNVETAAVRPDAERGASDTAADPQKPPLLLVLPDGSSEPIDRQTLVGRRPSVPRDVNSQQVQLITISDRGNGLSRTHLRIDPHGAGVIVTDLGSTNGTVLIRGSAKSIPLTPDVAQLAEVGDQLLLGGAAAVTIGTQH